LGRAYFPFCHPLEQQILIERAVAVLAEHGSSWPYTPQKLSTEMREIVRTGFSVRWAGANDPTSAIAVPVGRGDELVGSLVCSTYAKSLTQRRIEELVPEIRAVAEEILTIWRQCNPNLGAATAAPLPARQIPTTRSCTASFNADARLGPGS
jgi:DNA-binding IclR family transcriptional regulator